MELAPFALRDPISRFDETVASFIQHQINQRCESVRDMEIANVPFIARANGMQCEAQDAKFSQLNERIARTQCARQCSQKWDICDFRIPKLANPIWNTCFCIDTKGVPRST